MALTHATGKSGRSSRALRAGLAGALTVAGLTGVLVSPAAAATAAHDSGLLRAVALSGSAADGVQAQAAAQKSAAEARKAAEDRKSAEKRKAEEKRKADAKRKAEERAAESRTQQASARSAKRAAPKGFVAPVSAPVTTQYRSGGAMWSSGSHSGVDFAAASGTPVRAVGAGQVVEAGWGGAYGNNVVIRHSDGRYTQYGHLSAMDVRVGQAVTSGHQIGKVGSTGNSTGPHLHFEARTSPQYGSDVNPVSYLRSKGVGV
ncbi:peptidoglycan DD-metalloendopeptidase family protein [Streptomyces sp. 549]|uniref:M23 family metallopeptidase n=1 Tax=Streptomyces sp. 549 TaxID=3049076 RepID=UPI0024C2D4B7|nr:M23 family metallopeptidase [Streptomyces sp. 549]MDK1475943.1 peptidoglycan DD-metalloendopeptidase family protein [Streptomyces sp. 549]